MKRRWLAAGAIAVALAVGASGVALSQGKGSGEDRRSKKAQLREKFLGHLAEELGVSRAKLEAALKAAGIATVDDAVKAGLITKDQAAFLKGRIEAGDIGDFGFGLGRFKHHGPKHHRGFERKAKHHALLRLLSDAKARTAVADALAKKLGTSREGLLRSLGAGKDLEELATAKGITPEQLGASAASALKPHVDRLVKAGEVSREEADFLLERIAHGAFLGRLVRLALFAQ